MSKRNWTNVKAREPLIIAMREAGMTRQEIADELGAWLDKAAGQVVGHPI